MSRFNHHHQGVCYLGFAKKLLLLKQSDSDCFRNSNFSKAQIAHSLMMVVNLLALEFYI